MGRLQRKIFGSLLLIACSVAALGAKEDPSYKPGAAPGNALERLFRNNYAQPAVRPFDARGEETLDGMIRDGKLRITAEDAVRLALENNVDINVERYNPYLSLWGVEKEKAVLNSSLAFTTNLDRNTTPASSALSGVPTVFGLNTLYDAAYRKPFEFGLDLDANYSLVRYRTNNYFSTLNPSFTPVLGFRLTQHLLRDAGRISRGRYLRIARNNYSISEETFIERVSEIVTNVLHTYWELVNSQEEIKVREESKRLAELVLEQNKIQAEVGTMSALDVVQAEAEVATRHETLVTAQYARRILEDQLKKLISSRTDAAGIPAEIDPSSPVEAPPPPPAAVAQAIQQALASRPEIKQLLLDRENRRIDVDYSRNQLRPFLDIVGSYSQNGLGGLRIVRDYSGGIFNAPIVDYVPGGFWQSMDQLFTQRYLGYSVGLSLRVPLGNDDARATSAQAQIGFKQTEERLRSLQQKIAVEVRQIYELMEMSRARAEAAAATVRYQDKFLQGEQDKYALGATTTRFILEAQEDLRNAQSRLLRAKIDLIKSRITLDKALGETLRVRNIDLKQAMMPFK